MISSAKKRNGEQRGADGRTFGERLQMLMESRRMLQADLAAVMNVGRATVNQWVAGQSLPDAYNLLWIADHFQTDVRYLLHGPGSHPPAIARARTRRRSKPESKDPPSDS